MITACELASRLKAKRNGNGWMALCPAHEDKKPSLSISVGDGGKLLTNCFAGCTPEQVAATLHLNDTSKRIVAEYDYCDENGKLLYQSVRYEPKDFRQRRPDGRGGFDWNLNGTPRVLYRFPELLAADSAHTVLIPEGEKDCDRLAKLGLVATTNSGGAGKWRDEDNEYLRNRNVVILPDNDDTGRKHANEVATSLQGIAKSIRIIELPGLPEKGDVSDWLNAGGTKEELRKLKDEAPEFDPTLTAQPPFTTRPVEKPKKKKERKPRAALFVEPEPWDELVNGAELLNDIEATIKRYVDADDSQIRAAALWILFTYCFEAFYVCPLLCATSPVKRSGKTTLLTVAGSVVARPLTTSSISSAALFRAIEEFKPTLLIDEADTFLNDNEDLRGVINSGHTRATATVVRCNEKLEVQTYSTFAPKVIAMIGTPKDTIVDRSIVLRMKRAPGAKRLKLIRADNLAEEGAVLRSRAARFALDNAQLLGIADPSVPEQITSARARDNWRPLLAIADLCGGDWPQLARKAAIELSGIEELDNESLGEMLLSDIQQVYSEAKSERLFSKTLVDHLVALADRPWPEANNGKAITPAWLSRRLRPFSIYPKSLRIEPQNAKGYELASFQEAFNRYLPEQGESNRHAVTTHTNIDESENQTVTKRKACDAFKTLEGPYSLACDVVTVENPPAKVMEYREPTKAEWAVAAKDPELWDRMVIATERAAIESEELLA